MLGGRIRVPLCLCLLRTMGELWPMVSRVDYHARASSMEKSSIVVCKNSWASGTAGVTLSRVYKRFPGRRQIRASPSAKLYPAIVCKPPHRDPSHAAVTFLVSISALAHAPTRAQRGESWSPAIGARGSQVLHLWKTLSRSSGPRTAVTN